MHTSIPPPTSPTSSQNTSSSQVYYPSTPHIKPSLTLAYFSFFLLPLFSFVSLSSPFVLFCSLSFSFVFLEIVVTGQAYMQSVTAINAAWLPAIAQPLLGNYKLAENPPPRYDPISMPLSPSSPSLPPLFLKTTKKKKKKKERKRKEKEDEIGETSLLY